MVYVVIFKWFFIFSCVGKWQNNRLCHAIHCTTGATKHKMHILTIALLFSYRVNVAFLRPSKHKLFWSDLALQKKASKIAKNFLCFRAYLPLCPKNVASSAAKWSVESKLKSGHFLSQKWSLISQKWSLISQKWSLLKSWVVTFWV